MSTQRPPFPDDRRISRRGRSAAGLLAAGTLVLAVALAYLFVATGGRMTRAAEYTRYYDLQAEGFRRGHLHLSIDPPAALLRAENPFHPSNRPLWLWDATLHNGRYYIYWGPVPALALAAVKSVIPLRPVGDQYLALVFSFLRFLAGAALIMSMARWFRVRALSFPCLLGVALFGLATPLPYFLARGAVYEAAIAAGQFFLVAGLACAFRGLTTPRTARVVPWLLATGLCWALALGSRVSLLPCVAVLMLLLWGARVLIEGRPAWGRALALVAVVAVPVGASLVVLALYNHARFGSFTEVGVKSQLTWMNFRWSAEYIPLNAFMYLFRPLYFSCVFPFVKTPWMPVGQALPTWWKRPAGYDVEPLGGLFAAAPFHILALVPLALVVVTGLRRLRATHGSPTAFSSRLPVPALFIILAAVAIATLPALGYLGLWISSTRYTVDIAAGFSLLAIIGSWLLWTRPWRHQYQRAVAITLCLVLAAATLAAGLLLGTQGYHDQMQNHNPALWKTLTTLRLCR